MKKTMVIFLTIALTSGAPPLSVADESEHHREHAHDHARNQENKHGHNEDHDEDGHDEDGHDKNGMTKINDNMAKKAGITTAVAGTQSILQTITTFGRLMTGPEQTSHVLSLIHI